MSRAISSTLPQETKRIYCAYHPSELLTNFCCDADCLMPLCPNCIVEHTQQHFLENNKPCYVNLNEVMGETKQKCYQHIVMLQELSRCNDKILEYIMGLRESIHSQLMENKHEIYQHIDKLFEDYQQKLYAETVQKYKGLGVYDRKESTGISQFITQQIQTLHQQIGILKSQNCLAGLITYFATDGKIYEESIKELSEHVNKHKTTGKIITNNDAERLTKTLQGLCEQNMTVDFINQESKQQSEIPKQDSRKFMASRLCKKSCHQGKQNSNCHNDHRNYMKRNEQFYKIDALDMKTSKSMSRTTLIRPQCTIRHY